MTSKLVSAKDKRHLKILNDKDKVVATLDTKTGIVTAGRTELRPTGHPDARRFRILHQPMGKLRRCYGFIHAFPGDKWEAVPQPMPKEFAQAPGSRLAPTMVMAAKLCVRLATSEGLRINAAARRLKESLLKNPAVDINSPPV